MIHSFEQAAKINEEHGGKWFQPNTLKFRDGRLLLLYPTRGGAFFGASFRKGRTPRTYGVYFVSETTGKVMPWPDAQHYKSPGGANLGAKTRAEQWQDGCGLCDDQHAPDERCKSLEAE